MISVHENYSKVNHCKQREKEINLGTKIAEYSGFSGIKRNKCIVQCLIVV